MPSRTMSIGESSATLLVPIASTVTTAAALLSITDRPTNSPCSRTTGLAVCGIAGAEVLGVSKLSLESIDISLLLRSVPGLIKSEIGAKSL